MIASSSGTTTSAVTTCGTWIDGSAGGYQPKNNAPMDALAKLCGFPGSWHDGAAVYPAYLGQAGRHRRYCETDVMNPICCTAVSRKCAAACWTRSTSRRWRWSGRPGHLAPAEAHWDEYLKAWA